MEKAKTKGKRRSNAHKRHTGVGEEIGMLKVILDWCKEK
jgi:hypothetical protein